MDTNTLLNKTTELNTNRKNKHFGVFLKNIFYWF